MFSELIVYEDVGLLTVEAVVAFFVDSVSKREPVFTGLLSCI